MREDTVQDTICQRAGWVGVEALFLSEGMACEGHDFCKKYDLRGGVGEKHFSCGWRFI